jgi:hypothetical protein
MKPNSMYSLLFAGLLLVGAATSAAAQTDTQDHEAHHPADEVQTDAQAGPDPAAPGEAPAPGMPGGMSGMMDMMTPEMMQMMHRMMMGQPGDSTGQPGMMGRNMMDDGMMAGDMMRGGMMMQMMGAMQSGAALHGMMAGHHLALGLPAGTPEEMTPERVRTFLEERLARLGNPRLKLGEIATAENGSITAEIVTVDGSLVQKLAFNRYPGLVRQITD